MIEIDRASFLLGLVFGLILAVFIIAGSIVMAPRSQPAVAAAQTALASPAPSSAATRALPSATATPTATPQPTATPVPTATRAPTPPPAPTATPEPMRYQTVEVPPRRSVQVSIGAGAGEVLDLALMVDSDIDLTITDPSGVAVYGPTRVRRSYAGQLRSPNGGNFVLKLDNSFSIISTKQVMIQYRVLRP